MNMLKKIVPLLFVLCISLIAVLPLFHEGFIPIHDDTQIARVHQMSVALADGLFPVRIVEDLGYGYGYPIFNFYAPFAYYVGGLLALIGFSALSATKLMMGIGMLLAALFMYLLAKRFMRDEGAVISSLLYMFAPYHAVNLYVRGAVAELWAYAFIPLALYGLVRVYKEVSWGSVSIAALGLAGVILSHNLTALMLIPFYGIFFFILMWHAYKNRQKRTVGLLLTSAVLGVLLSAFYWIPALGEMQYTNVSSQITGGSQYKDHFVCLDQLWAGVWGYGGSTAGCLDGLSFQIGKFHIGFAVFGLILLVLSMRKTRPLGLLLLGAVVSFFMVIPQSKFVWDLIPQLAYIQFPWRFLQFIVFFTSLSGGYVVSFLLQQYLSKKQLVGWGVVLFLVSGMLLLYQKNFTPQTYLTEYRDETDRNVVRWTVSKISDEYLPKGFVKPTSSDDLPGSLLEGNVGKITIETQKTQYIKAHIFTPEETEITINKAVFPAWQLSLNSQKISPEEKNGLYSVTVPSESSLLEIRFVQTPLEKVGNMLSVVGFLGVVIGIIMRGKRIKHAKTS